MSDGDEGDGEAAAEEEDEESRQPVAVVDAERKVLQEEVTTVKRGRRKEAKRKQTYTKNRPYKRWAMQAKDNTREIAQYRR